MTEYEIISKRICSRDDNRYGPTVKRLTMDPLSLSYFQQFYDTDDDSIYVWDADAETDMEAMEKVKMGLGRWKKYPDY